MLDAESEKNCTRVKKEENCMFTGNWSEEELQRAFNKIKFAITPSMLLQRNMEFLEEL